MFYFFLTVIWPSKVSRGNFRCYSWLLYLTSNVRKNVQKFDKVLLDDFFTIAFEIHLFHGQLSINLLKKKKIVRLYPRKKIMFKRGTRHLIYCMFYLRLVLSNQFPNIEVKNVSTQKVKTSILWKSCRDWQWKLNTYLWKQIEKCIIGKNV